MNALKTLVLFMMAVCLTLLVACEEKGPAEKAGEKLDDALNSAKNQIGELAK